LSVEETGPAILRDLREELAHVLLQTKYPQCQDAGKILMKIPVRIFHGV
jgi:hypothetical protein